MLVVDGLMGWSVKLHAVEGTDSIYSISSPFMLDSELSLSKHDPGTHENTGPKKPLETRTPRQPVPTGPHSQQQQHQRPEPSPPSSSARSR